MESKGKKKKGHEEPSGKTGIKTQNYQRIDLRIRGAGRVSQDKVREWHGHIYTTKSKIGSQWEVATQHREISTVLCDYLEGWDMECGRETQEGGDMGIYVQLQMIHFVIQQKLTQNFKQLYSNEDVKKKKSKKILDNGRKCIKMLTMVISGG